MVDTSRSKAFELTAIASAALVVTLVFVNRWVITDLGVLSFGRVWQYFVSYTDFGFARRELWGTVLSITGINHLFENAYYFAYVFYVIEVIALLGGVWLFLLKNASDKNFWFYTALFFSPVLVLQSGYLTGTQDLQLLLIAFFLALYVRNNIVFTIGCCAGVLTHELFVFLLPFLFLVQYLKTAPAISLRGVFSWRMIAPAGMVVLVILVTVLGGRLDISKSRYEQVMAEKMPVAAHQHSLWSGYSEISSSVEKNADTASHTLAEIRNNLAWVAVPLAYALLIAFIAVYFLSIGSVRFRTVLFVSILLPLLTVLVATDVYRWIGMTGDLAWLLILVATGRGQHTAPRWCFIVLTLFVVVAPFGAAQIDWPFPAQQLLLEKAGVL